MYITAYFKPNTQQQCTHTHKLEQHSIQSTHHNKHQDQPRESIASMLSLSSQQEPQSIFLVEEEMLDLKSSLKVELEDGDIPFNWLSSAFADIERESGRIKMQQMLARCYTKILDQRSLTVPTRFRLLEQACLITCGEIAPSFENIEFNIGSSIIKTAVLDEFNLQRGDLSTLFKKLGDLALMVEELILSRNSNCSMVKSVQTKLANHLKIDSEVDSSPLMIGELFNSLEILCNVCGSGSRNQRLTIMRRLLRKASRNLKYDVRYLIRLLCRDMRIGVVSNSMLVSLSMALVAYFESRKTGTLTAEYILEKQDANLTKTVKEISSAIKEAYFLCTDVRLILKHILQLEDLSVRSIKSHEFIQPGTPVKPMLAKIKKYSGIREFVESLEKRSFTLEFKYDGQRAQVHILPDGSIKIFSRHLKNQTQQWCDLVRNISRSFATASSENQQVRTTSAILDCEIVGVDRSASGEPCKILSFQTLASRSKTGEEQQEGCNVMLLIFDLLYLNGESLLKQSLRERRGRLLNCLEVEDGHVEMVKYLDVETFEDDKVASLVEEFFELSLSWSGEGLMLKYLDADSEYEPSVRCDRWLKVKKDYVLGVVESLDLVPLGGWYGSGRKAGWLSPLLMGAYDASTGCFYTVCKVISGFSDDMYRELTSFYLEHQYPSHPPHYIVSNDLIPPVWFRELQVWEIQGADFTISPVHSACRGDILPDQPYRGVSIRFPRFIRKRVDKSVDDCTSTKELLEICRRSMVTTEFEDLQQEEEYF